MGKRRSEDDRRSVDPLDPETVEARLRTLAREVVPDGLVDDAELRHLIRVLTECSLLLSDVYSEERIARIMHPDRGFLGSLIDHLRRDDEGVLYRVRRLPDDVRVVGDKALFDLALSGLTRVKGYDLSELGSKAYRTASDALELLAEDRRLRDFFKQNRLLMLPVEDEVVFLRQCSDRFELYTELLRRFRGQEATSPIEETASRVTLMAAAAEALAEEMKGGDAVPSGEADEQRYVRAAQGDVPMETVLSRDQLLSAYERMILFASLDHRRLREAMKATVIDQEAAVDTLCDEFGLFAAGTKDVKRPPAYFLVGPTGVGKNHFVESLCRLLEGIWNVEVPLLTIEGPNYTYPSDINELRGATRGFIRSDEEGLLTSFHERASRSPLSVMLIDEVEKAHPQLRKFFLSILDRGTTTDNRGNLLSFGNCMIFFTSNLGYSDAQQATAPIGYLDEEQRERRLAGDARRDLRKTLSPEFVNRVRLIHFNRLGRTSVERILELEMAKIASRYERMHGLRIELDETARGELIRQGFSPEFGARPLTTLLERVCNVEVAKIVRRDDRRSDDERHRLLSWVREIREGSRPFDRGETRRRILESTRADLGYSTLRVVFRDGEFGYLPQAPEGRHDD